MTEYDTCEEARREIAEYIGYYRRDRKHSALGYLSPTQFERLTTLRS
jgi:transposase InsO family protein